MADSIERKKRPTVGDGPESPGAAEKCAGKDSEDKVPKGLYTRREILVGAAAVSAAAVAGAVFPRSTRAQIPGPRATKRPNILLVISDQHRFDWLGRNPDIPVPTPNLDRLGKRGVDFTGAIVASPVCGPSRSCLASGMEYENCGVPQNRYQYPAEKTTFNKHLRNSGYHTMACGKIDLYKGVPGLSLDGRMFMEEWGFSDMEITGSATGHYLQAPVGPKEPYMAYLDSLDPPLGRTHAEDIARRRPKNKNWWGMTDTTPLDDEHYKENYTGRTGLELLRRASNRRPWFLIVNFNKPHPPMDITRRMERLYRGLDRVIDGFPQPHNYTGPFPPEQHIRIRQNYAAMIEIVDSWLGSFQKRLRLRGELDDTIIIYTADHGEMLGHNGGWGKSTPYCTSVGVPLVMAGPGIAAGVRSDALVSMMDLAATCLDYGGVDIPAEMESRSLRPLLDAGKGDHRDFLRSALKTGKAAEGRWRMVQDHRYKLIDGFFDQRALFDLEADPWETENIAAAKPGEVARLAELFPEI